jgi:hypothetical protein
MDPDEPELEVPVLRDKRPLRPNEPAFDTESNIDPLDETVEYPLTTRIIPPDDDDECPDLSDSSPP